jgi:hypothetical protein
LNSKRTVRASSASTRAMPASCVCVAGRGALAGSIAKLWRTSSASTGSPLLKRAWAAAGSVTLPKSGATHRLGQQPVDGWRLVLRQVAQGLDHPDQHAAGALPRVSRG